MTQLEQAIYDTVRYFDIFDMPVTATQVWECLIVEQKGAVRWAGHAHYSLLEVQQELRQSEWLGERLGTRYGFYFMQGRDSLVKKRLGRHALAQQKWKIARRAAWWLALVPFVRGMAGSGSLALDNVKESSDLDFFVITKAGRIWTARLGLMVMSQLLGRRRKYWMGSAPDKICLNHYVTDGGLAVSPDIHNMYTAMAYSALVPVYGREIVEVFQVENGAWIRSRVMPPELPEAGHLYEVRHGNIAEGMKRLLEGFLLEPVGDWVERMAERLQRAVIERHLDARRAGRVAVSDHELAFHPDTKVPAILKQFYADPGQQRLI